MSVSIENSYSYLPIDVGFDLRLHKDICVELPNEERLCVTFLQGGRAQCATGTRQEVRERMIAAGYNVRPLRGPKK